MHFSLIDRITHLEPGQSIRAIKALSLAEEYLQDHFPKFPVMPGVLMTEALFEATAWLIRKSEDFEHSVVVLKEVRNVKYSGFVAPGEVLEITSQIVKQDDVTTTAKVSGEVNGETTVNGRLVIERYNLLDRDEGTQGADDYMRQCLRQAFTNLYRPAA